MDARRHRLRPITVASLLAVAGCAGPVTQIPSDEPRMPESGRDAGQAPASLGGAAAALVTESAGARRSGDLASAEATLERALRIAPGAPEVWLELARVRLEKGDYAQAAQLARKAESLAQGDAALSAESRALFAEAKRREGSGT